MTAQLLAGAPVAEAVLADVTKRVEALADRGKTVGLGTILVGDDAASAGYVRKKHETSEQVGVASHHIEVSGDRTQADLLAAVERFNADPGVDAYLIQHPVPRQFDFNAALLAMDPGKDADGLHPVSLGKLVLQEDGPVPATPAGIREMFVHYGIDIAGKHVVVCGRSNIVGKPIAAILMQKNDRANATVTLCHTATSDLGSFTRQADILIAAMGSPRAITAEMVKPGVVVVDVGNNWIEDETRQSGRRLVGDVDFEAVRTVASAITPVPGGVGPMTVAMLLSNTVMLAEQQAGRH